MLENINGANTNSRICSAFNAEPTIMCTSLDSGHFVLKCGVASYCFMKMVVLPGGGGEVGWEQGIESRTHVEHLAIS